MSRRCFGAQEQERRRGEAGRTLPLRPPPQHNQIYGRDQQIILFVLPVICYFGDVRYFFIFVYLSGGLAIVNRDVNVLWVEVWLVIIVTRSLHSSDIELLNGIHQG